MPSTAEIESEGMVPPVLYVPIVRGSSQDDPRVPMPRLKDGRVALLAYTALDRLTSMCGPAQNWALVRTSELDDLRQRQDYDVVILDLELPESVREREVKS